MSFSVKKFVTGPIETNTYLISNETGSCLIIDPSTGQDKVLKTIADENLKPAGIVITHGHFDHIGGIPQIISRFPELTVYIHAGEKTLLTDPQENMSFVFGDQFSYNGAVATIDEGPVTIGSISGTVLVVPGHSPSGCALLIDKYLFCGDILFAGSVGRTDFPGGNHAQLIDGIKKKLMVLDDATVVCPGHMGRSTIGRERTMNPFI